MSKIYEALTKELEDFINKQKMFFVATATKDSSINLSPKGLDSLRIIDSKRLVWLNLAGSGNETFYHSQKDGRMTIMFNAFNGNPLILRVYGKAKVIQQKDGNWDDVYKLFTPIQGARQIFDLTIHKIQTSCGFAVPIYEYVKERNELVDWAEKQGKEGIKQYQKKKNAISIDGDIIKF